MQEFFFSFLCAACNFYLPTSACRKFFFKITHPPPQELNGRPLRSLGHSYVCLRQKGRTCRKHAMTDFMSNVNTKSVSATPAHTTAFALPSIFSPLEMLGIKIWETPLSWHAKCPLPVVVRVSKTCVLKLPINTRAKTTRDVTLLIEFLRAGKTHQRKPEDIEYEELNEHLRI